MKRLRKRARVSQLSPEASTPEIIKIKDNDSKNSK